jgi:DNA-binding NtrC family response regulator
VQNILIVDALDNDALVLASALRIEGFQVVLVPSATKAKEALARTPMVLAIVDLMLRTETGANGLELARELKQAYPAMRMLLTSAYHLSERQLERADCGVSGFIPKPYDVMQVVSFVREKAAGPPSSRRLWHPEDISSVVRIPLPPVAARARR